MTVWALLGIAAVAAMAAVTLRQTQPVFATALTVFVGAVLLLGAMQTAWPLFDQVRTLLSRFSATVPFADILLKALGISLLAQAAADICRDAGETALASRAEFGGKVMILACGMPLFTYAVQMLEQVVSGEAVGF